MPHPTLILDAGAALGEGPRWHAGEACLYWVDIARAELHRFDPATGTDAVRSLPEPAGCFAFRRAGGLLLAMQSGFFTLADWDATPQPFGPRLLAGQPDYRFNDGRTDPAGRFWAGTVDTAKASHQATLYRLDPDGRATPMLSGMTTCNGAAFTADGRRFAHADTPTHRLRMFEVGEDGTLGPPRDVHAWPHGQGRPDGGSFDLDGCYWTALFDGGRVVRIGPDGAIRAEVRLPVSRPTMIVFGGEDDRTAFVTSARVAGEPGSGGIFSFPVDTPGVPEFPFG